VPFLKLLGVTAGGWQMARAGLLCCSNLTSGRGEAAFARDKIATARFYAEHVLPQAAALSQAITLGGGSLMSVSAEHG
jgi:acyl-CoA dehydrogenase